MIVSPGARLRGCRGVDGVRGNDGAWRCAAREHSSYMESREL